MVIRGFGREDLLRMEQALRAGEPLSLEISGPPPAWVRLDEFIPLCHSVRAWHPEVTAALRAFLPPEARPGQNWTVTAIIPTHRQRPIGLEALKGQDLQVTSLVLVNGRAASTPMDWGADQVLRVPWEGHGRTRQSGVEASSSDYVLFTVDDALPMGAGFVRTLVEALEEGGYDAVFARQVPWPTATRDASRRIRHWTPPGQHHRLVRRLDHVAALYRRSTLLAHPLPPVPIAEDLHWRQGKRIGYVPRAPVVHSHTRRPMSLFLRNRAIHAEHIRLGDAPHVPSFLHLLRSLPGVLDPSRTHSLQEVWNQGAELAGQWMAAMDSRRDP